MSGKSAAEGADDSAMCAREALLYELTGVFTPHGAEEMVERIFRRLAAENLRIIRFRQVARIPFEIEEE